MSVSADLSRDAILAALRGLEAALRERGVTQPRHLRLALARRCAAGQRSRRAGGYCAEHQILAARSDRRGACHQRCDGTGNPRNHAPLDRAEVFRTHRGRYRRGLLTCLQPWPIDSLISSNASTALSIFLTGKSQADLVKDRHLRLTLEREFEIICEAARKIPEKIKDEEICYRLAGNGRRSAIASSRLSSNRYRHSLLHSRSGSTAAQGLCRARGRGRVEEMTISRQ